MAWIQVEQALPTHRKTMKLADTLDITPTHAVGLMVTLWLWSLDNAPSGELDDIPPRTLARILHWDGDCEELMEAMRGAGFLDDNEIHDWQEYAGRLLEQRAAAKERMQKHRKKKQVDSDTDTLREQNVNDTRTLREQNAHVLSKSTVHYSTLENSTLENTTPENSIKDKDSKGDKPPAAEAASKEPVPFKKIQELFLETCPSYPAIRAINGQRKKAVAARWNEHKDIEVFKAVFEKAEASSFLKGRNERNWAATFDWMMKPTNFLKILEDNYQEKSSKDKEPADSSDRKAPALTGFKMATSSDEVETGPYNGHNEEKPETTQGHKLTGFKMATDPEDED